jgi:hypothetical protein
MNKFVKITFVAAMLASTSAFAENRLPSVMTGGVGSEQEARMEAVEDMYNTKLVFTGEGGMYLANVSVIIRNKNGEEVINGYSDGPILLAQLVPGRYSVDAEVSGHVKTRTINVGKTAKTHQFQFPIKDDSNLESPNSLYYNVKNPSSSNAY